MLFNTLKLASSTGLRKFSDCNILKEIFSARPCNIIRIRRPTLQWIDAVEENCLVLEIKHMRRATNTTVVLKDTELWTTGMFRCEVLADAPSFHTVTAEALMQIGGKGMTFSWGGKILVFGTLPFKQIITINM
ncbi:hypothetical protein TNCV_4152701 [Trichonephila clavipes]|nr:hypothetical protein TNCV_4152701 [Trichonephila clavipes]